MAITAEELETLILAQFPDAQVDIVDLAGDNNHFKAIIRSSSFQGKSRVQQHQMVYDSLRGRLGDGANQLHALALQTEAKE